MTLSALIESLAAVALLGIFLVPPGFVVGWLGNLFGFRSTSSSERILVSVVLSFAITPSIAVLAGRSLHRTPTLALFLVLAATALLLWGRSRQASPRAMSPATKIAVAMLAFWCAVALLSVVEWQIGHRLYFSAIIYDHCVRVPFVNAAIHNGTPPSNPFFHLGTSPVLRYYYYWYVVASLPGQLVHLSPQACLSASIVWAGFGLAALVPLSLKYLLGESVDLRKKSLFGIAALVITGLDIIPFLLICWKIHRLAADMEWWDPNQITSWLGSLLWVPHHVAALVACVAGLLTLLQVRGGQTGIARAIAVIVAAMAFASGAGLSLYVTFTFAAFCAVWMLVLAWQRDSQGLMNWIGASALSLLFALPYLRDLLTGTSGAGSRFAVFALRDFPAGIQMLQAMSVTNTTALDFAKLPIVVLVYGIEFGFFFCVAVLRFREDFLTQKAATPGVRCAWVLFATSVFIVTIFQSDTTGSNDLGFRGVLPTQFVLLLWSAPVLFRLFRTPATYSRFTRFALYVTLFIGVLSTTLQLGLLRSFSYLADTHRIHAREADVLVPDLGQHTYLVRQGLAELNARDRSQSVVQYDVTSPSSYLIRLYANRPFAAGDEGCGINFGGDVSACTAALPALQAIYDVPLTEAEVDATCRRYDIHVLLVTRVEPVWNNANSWVWQRQPLAANAAIRALPCGD